MDSLSQHSSSLDLLRTIAILLVFTSHFNTFAGGAWFKPVGQFGWIGVDLDGLALGVSIAALYRLRPNLWQKVCKYSNLVFISGIFFLSCALFMVVDEYSLMSSSLGYPLIDIGFACLVVAALAPSGFLSHLKIPGVRNGATLAFSFYLTHKAVIHHSKNWILSAGITETSILYPLGIFLSCLLASTTLYFLIEKPFLILRDRIIHGTELARDFVSVSIVKKLSVPMEQAKW